MNTVGTELMLVYTRYLIMLVVHVFISFWKLSFYL